MALDNTYAILIGIVALAAAVPWVLRIRHPEQKPFAAYLVFVSVFLLTAALIFSLVTWLLALMDLGQLLARPLAAALFLFLVFVPALGLATWQARKPPFRRPPPA